MREAKAKVCSQTCRAEYQRHYQLDYYHSVRSQDAADTEKRQARARARRAGMLPEEKLADGRKRAASEDKDHVRQRERFRHQERVATEPNYADKKRADRARLIASDPEKKRTYQREYARRRRARRVEVEAMKASGEIADEI